MSDREVHITVARETEIDPTRVEEYVKANYDDGDQVQVIDTQTGENYYDNIGSDEL